MNRYVKSVLFERSLYLDYFQEGFVGLFLCESLQDTTFLKPDKSEAVLKV